MNVDLNTFTTGLPGLDRTLGGLLAGDNVVWQVETVDDYLPFVDPFWEAARRQNRKLVYFRFARHRELVKEGPGAFFYRLHPEEGFERFLGEILDIIEQQGVGACYVFDWLSDLAADWYSDHMLGNFFRITCPYLFDMNTIAYFGLRKNQHSFEATGAINRTAQVILEVYRHRHSLYLHPQKVFNRYSPTLYMLHSWRGEEFQPVTSSAITTEILAKVPHPWMDFTIHRPGVWLRTFRQAQATYGAVRSGKKPALEAEAFFERVLKMIVTRDERFAGLAKNYFDLGDLIEIMKRMIGTGLIGGKTLGMLLARAILRKHHPRWSELLERHDSFFIGSDVFYTYLVENGCWWLRRRIPDFEAYLENAAKARERILTGEFPESICEQFQEMLEYFGQSPIIVRSSSLLEDNYGNAFSGKYESVFCANQGTPPERLKAFMAAVRTIYASALSEESLRYRKHHQLLERDEQMALLVQRVSGEMHGSQYFPQIAGVGFSFNPFVWQKDIDPAAGVLRLVFGLGTRAVDRTEDDYTRLVALNKPLKRPEAESGRQFCQRGVDVLDLKANQLLSVNFHELAPKVPENLLSIVAEYDDEMGRQVRLGKLKETSPWLLTFASLLSETPFVADMREMLRVLEEAYAYPVDIEFAANFFPEGDYQLNLLQCRPFQVKIRGEGSLARLPEVVPDETKVLESTGPIVGHSLATSVDRLIYVVPSVYSKMPMSQRYTVARTIGRLTRLSAPDSGTTIMLVGPGRWGTSMPALGIPVSFAEINNVSILCEVALMHEGIIPDISLGTHFFNDLVEMDMLYLAVSPGRDGHVLNEAALQERPNLLLDLLPTAEGLSDAIRVIDSSPHTDELRVHIDSMQQHGLCYFAPTGTPAAG